MKKQNKLSIKVRDLEPLKDVTGGRRRNHQHHPHHKFQDQPPPFDPVTGAGKWDY